MEERADGQQAVCLRICGPAEAVCVTACGLTVPDLIALLCCFKSGLLNLGRPVC